MRASGLGTIYSMTTVRRQASPDFPAPYVNALVELDEGPRLLTTIVGGPCAIGDRVRVTWKDRGRGAAPAPEWLRAEWPAPGACRDRARRSRPWMRSAGGSRTSVVSDDIPVSAEATIAYARATNDTNPRHLSGELAPPLFAVVPSLKTLVRPKKAATSLHSLHGEHDLVVHRPIVPGMTLRTHARLVGVHPSPAGAVMVGRGETRTVEGELVNEQHLTWVFRGETVAALHG